MEISIKVNKFSYEVTQKTYIGVDDLKSTRITTFTTDSELLCYLQGLNDAGVELKVSFS